MACRRTGRTPGSGETGLPRTRGGLRTPSGESGLPAPAAGAPGGPSSGSLANPSFHLGMDHGTRCADGNWPRWIRTTIPRSKVWCPAVGRGASWVVALELSGAGAGAGASDSPAHLCGTIKVPACVSIPVETDRLGRRTPPKTEVAGASTRSEEHTSELQSHSDLVCRLLLEKKKKKKNRKQQAEEHGEKAQTEEESEQR